MFEGTFEAVEVSVVVDLEGRTGIFTSLLEDFPVSYEVEKALTEVVSEIR
jgi:hypothetical protein